jgi:hypothetical protein
MRRKEINNYEKMFFNDRPGSRNLDTNQPATANFGRERPPSGTLRNPGVHPRDNQMVSFNNNE